MSGRVLVTAALPYANGSIHLGHLLESIQTDVYVRARKLAGDDVIFMWAADTHGTPIELRARKEGITPEALIERAHAEHAAVFRDFGIGSDIYYTTHSPETQRHAEGIFAAMKAAGYIHTRVTTQLYCPNDQMFLPDRFVRGQCPKCGSLDQYGDSCEVCGSTYAPTELKEPLCSICGTPPVPRGSEHLFVALGQHEAVLRAWLNGGAKLQQTVRNYVMRWVDDGLRDWDISRDPPYFGFAIPGYDNKKFFYVWFDAPVGYIGATEKWCSEHGRDVNEYWRGDAEIVHVIGKDIVYFHTLFWPAMLHTAGYTAPSRVQVHGWLTVNGEKMSKSRGTFILGRTFLEHLPADYLRYYFAAKLGAEQDDIDLSMEDFANRVNAELVNKAANLASRCVKFVHQRLGARMSAPAADAEPLLAKARARLAEVPGLYREFESARALRSRRARSVPAAVYGRGLRRPRGDARHGGADDAAAPGRRLPRAAAGPRAVLAARADGARHRSGDRPLRRAAARRRRAQDRRPRRRRRRRSRWRPRRAGPRDRARPRRRRQAAAAARRLSRRLRQGVLLRRLG